MADEKLLHSEDVIFNKPSLKEFIRLIKNGSVQSIWPSNAQEQAWWNSVGINQYKDYGAKPVNNLNTALTVFYGDNEDTKSTENLNKEESIKEFNGLNTSIQAIQKDIKDKCYIAENENLNYPELIYNEDTGEITNKQNYINHNNIIISNYQQHIATINKLIEKLTTYKPERDPSKVIPKLSNTTFEKRYNDLYIISEDNNSGSILDKLNNTYKNKLSTLSNERTDIVNLLKSKNIIGDRDSDVFDISGIRSIIQPIHNTIINQADPILKTYYAEDTDMPGDDYETIGFDTQYSNLLSKYIENYEDIQRIFKESLTKLFVHFQTDNYNNIHTDCIGSIKLQRAVVPEDEDKIDQLNNNDNLFYNTYLSPYYRIIKQIGYLTGVGRYLNDDGEEVTDEEYLNLKLQDLKQNIKRAVTIEEKIDLVNDFLEYFEQAELNNLGDSKLYFFTRVDDSDNQDIDPSLNNIVFLMNGEIQNKETILNTMHTIIAIINTEQDIIQENNLTGSFSHNYNSIWDETEIGYILSNFKNIKNDYENIYTGLMVYFEYYNTLVRNLRELKILINNQITPFNLSNTEFINRLQVKQSLNEYRKKLFDHYTLALCFNSTDLSISNNFEQAITIIDALIDEIDDIDIILSDGAKEEDYDNLIILFNNSNIQKLVYILTGNTKTYNENDFIPIASPDYYTITNSTDIEIKLQEILSINEDNNREYYLSQYLSQMSNLIQGFVPIYSVEPFYHYTCFSSGSEVLFNNGTLSNKDGAVATSSIDGTTSIIVDNIIYYPKLNGLTNSPTSARNTEIPTIAGLKNILGDNFDKLGTTSIGNTYNPIYFDQGAPLIASNVVQGQYKPNDATKGNYWNIVRREGDNIDAVSISAVKMYGAVYNDYAEYRAAEAEPGRCIIENGDGTLSLSTGRLQLGANIVSDTYGFAIGETDDATCPIAVCGRVLAHPLESKEVYHPGAAVCSGPEGTISLMTREEIREWPDAIVGYVSEVPIYDTWGTDNVAVNGRIWIKIK